MSNILILVGSMRINGNTAQLAQSFAEGAAQLPNLFDPIIMQYQMVLDFFRLESIGTILVRGIKDIGDTKGSSALKEAYDMGVSIE
ncbi:MAG: hypothetical protein IJJ81_00955 [Ruminococcus sp.]|nr:hypothetical protein [Ruminococcus sp.]